MEAMTVRRYVPEGCNLHTCRRVNLKSHNIIFLFVSVGTVRLGSMSAAFVGQFDSLIPRIAISVEQCNIDCVTRLDAECRGLCKGAV
jgi:hypothetical protein